MRAGRHFEFIAHGSGVRSVLTLSLGLLLSGGVALGQVPRTATAEATVVDGFVLGLTLTDGGAGYGVPPIVSFTGGGGSGASAVAKVRNGVVDRIALMKTGAGYSSKPVVTIAPPVVPMLESVRPVIGLMIRGQVGTTHYIEVADAVSGSWVDQSQVVVSGSPYQWLDENATTTRRFYRVRAEGAGEAPAIDSARVISVKLMIRGTVGTTNWILAADGPYAYPWRMVTNGPPWGSVLTIDTRFGPNPLLANDAPCARLIFALDHQPSIVRG